MAKRYMNGELRQAIAKSERIKIRVRKSRARAEANKMCITFEVPKDLLSKIVGWLLNKDMTESEVAEGMRASNELLKLTVEAIAASFKAERPHGPIKHLS